MRSPRAPVALAALLLPLGASAQEFKISGQVKVDYDKSCDFSKFKTYTWSPAQEPAANPADHIRIFAAIEKELQARGLVMDESGKPDIRVRYFSKVQRKLKGESSSSDTAWRPTPDQRTNVDFKMPREATLTVTLYDAESGEIVWSASSSETVGRPDEIPDQITAVIKRVMKPFPPPAAAPPP